MQTLPSLWTALRSMFARMHRTIGPAAELAERVWIGPAEQREIRAWLAPLMAMVRKIILLEALVHTLTPPTLCTKRSNSAPRSQRQTSLRLWPKPKRPTARVRQLGPPVLVRDIWRDRIREAQAQQLARARLARAAPQVLLARRIDALAHLMREPQRAIRRLARKLHANHKLALTLGAQRMPRTQLYNNTEYDAVAGLSFDGGVAFARLNTS